MPLECTRLVADSHGFPHMHQYDRFCSTTLGTGMCVCTRMQVNMLGCPEFQARFQGDELIEFPDNGEPAHASSRAQWQSFSQLRLFGTAYGTGCTDMARHTNSSGTSLAADTHPLS